LAIPLALSGADLLVRARSGTGKTAAFGVPAVLTATAAANAANSVSVSAPRALILAPTREVALQAADVVSSLLSRFPLSSSSLSPRPSVAAFVGGLPLSADIARCRRPLAVVAATPGRARALASGGASKCSAASSAAVPALDLSGVSLLVLDEADALLSAPLAADVSFLASACGCPGGGGGGGQRGRGRGGGGEEGGLRHPQVMAFSATLDAASEEAASRLMASGSPRRVDASPRGAGPALEGVTHYYLPIVASPEGPKKGRSSSSLGLPPPTQRQRDAAVVTALSSAPFCQAAVFVSSRARAASLSEALAAAGFPAVELSGALPQPRRMEAVAALRAFSARVAVATDLGARGVDLERVNLVVNADGLPREWRRRGGGRGSAGGASEDAGSDGPDDGCGGGDDETEGTVPPPPPRPPLPEGAATLAHRAGRAGRFGGRGACVTLVSTDDEDDGGEGTGGEGGQGAGADKGSGELARLRRALTSLGAPPSAPQRLPPTLPAAAYRYSPPTPEERRRHGEMLSLREEAEKRRRGEERGEEGEPKEESVSGGGGSVVGENGGGPPPPPSSVLRYSSEELRAMRGTGGEASSPPPVPLPAALAKAAPAAAAAVARPKSAAAAPAPKTPAAKVAAKARFSVPPRASPPPPPPRESSNDEFDLDDDALEAAIRAVHAAAAAEEGEEEEGEGEEEEAGEGGEADGEGREQESGGAAAAAPPSPPPPPPSPPLPSSALLPRPVPCPACSVMVPPECCRPPSSSSPSPSSSAEEERAAACRGGAGAGAGAGANEPLVAVPAALLRRYYELEWDAWARRSERWQQAAAWHSWWAAAPAASAAAASGAGPGQEQQR